MTRNLGSLLSLTVTQAKRGLRRKPVVTGLAVGSAVLSACAVWGLGARAYSRNTSTSALSVKPSPIATLTRRSATAIAVQAADDTQVKLVTLTPRGFEPDELLVSQKRFVLAIDNRSQLDTASIRFSQLTGNPAAPLSQLHLVQMPGGKVNSNTGFELPPGNYVLTEAKHPSWVCAITVISK